MKPKKFVKGKRYIFIPYYPNPNHVEEVECLGIEGDRIYIQRPTGRDSTNKEFLAPLKPYVAPPSKEDKPIVYADFCDTCFHKENNPKRCKSCNPTKYPKLVHNKIKDFDKDHNYIVKKKTTKVRKYPYKYFRKGMSIKEICAYMKRKFLSAKHWSKEEDKRRIYEEILSLKAIAAHYEAVLGFPMRDTMEVMEACRRSSLGSHYKHWGKIKNLDYIFETKDDFKKRFPSGQYRCGRCGGISTDPVICNSGKHMEPGQICNWKAYGLFGPMKPYISYIIKNGSAAKMKMQTIFAPIEVEHLHK